MLSNLVLTVISEDKPGVVEAISRVVKDNNGNWLESQLSHLAGKFAGVISLQVAAESEAKLIADLRQLNERKINIIIDNSPGAAAASDGKRLDFRVWGPDRAGIVKEIATTFAQYNINVEKLNTRISSMPYSGEPLFEADGTLTLPSGLNQSELEDKLDEIEDTLAIDISLQTREE
ncbi:glycine cleavage system protein R [Teredinibacter waterburyi]|jgi:Glycine cleavage system regulatory protein|uniref:glycine cleavage system protein R n=1 Tax=Teredinibacter waterburyi TaxID=1500538 RepID=UPI00165EE59F|nr:ACT domain-containing protein [Teredinibacter waterburyi]